MVDEVMFSSKQTVYSTPQWLIDALGPFDLDVCASPDNAKAPRYYTEKINGLEQPWDAEKVWCNPPYGRGISDWVEKAIKECNLQNYDRCAMLLPSRTDTKWFCRAYGYCSEMFFIRGRLTFQSMPHPAPFPSVLFFFRPELVPSRNVYFIQQPDNKKGAEAP